SWHEENEREAGVHLEYELEHGRSGKSDGSGETPGNEDAQVEEIGFGQSEGDVSKSSDGEEHEEIEVRDSKKKAGKLFGKEHLHVVYEEQRIEPINEMENRQKLMSWRELQRPFVRSFIEEMKKRID
ncbi:hypothetical protein J4G37_53255, partial [Microvirga sp. 3-52]|nr:hypothetical protein [Microvirga sp. 3-52]